ncbi:MAG: response regulator [Anaerolineae bacterium]|nr:response regulator [Anaerolineae bacterium]
MSPHLSLIIDNDENNISVLSQLLQIEGAGAIALTNLNGLTQHLDAVGRVSVVFLDLEFPRSNGYEALEVIKAHPQFQGVPVIAYTVHVNEFEKIEKLGFDGLIGKPVDADEFPVHWQKILSGQKIWHIP